MKQKFILFSPWLLKSPVMLSWLVELQFRGFGVAGLFGGGFAELSGPLSLPGFWSKVKDAHWLQKYTHPRTPKPLTIAH